MKPILKNKTLNPVGTLRALIRNTALAVEAFIELLYVPLRQY
jgi:hypothetical protein